MQGNDDDKSNIDKICTILVSTRGSTEPNPLKKPYKDNQPPTEQELENYLHIHPAIKEVEEVQEILQVLKKTFLLDGAIDLDDIIANIDACEIKVTAGCKPMTVRQTTQIALEARRGIFLSILTFSPKF